MALTTDSLEYEILADAVRMAKDLDINALSCEIGLREGGGSKFMLDALWETGQGDRTHLALDPYGNIDYETAEGNVRHHDYTNIMRNRCMVDLHAYIFNTFQNRLNVVFFCLEDTEFFNRFADGVPIYSEVKRLATQYAVVHYDGPHARAPLDAELAFFTPRMVKGGLAVFDDIANYDHTAFENESLFPAGYELVSKGSRKASYRKL